MKGVRGTQLHLVHVVLEPVEDPRTWRLEGSCHCVVVGIIGVVIEVVDDGAGTVAEVLDDALVDWRALRGTRARGVDEILIEAGGPILWTRRQNLTPLFRHHARIASMNEFAATKCFLDRSVATDLQFQLSETLIPSVLARSFPGNVDDLEVLVECDLEGFFVSSVDELPFERIGREYFVIELRPFACRRANGIRSVVKNE